MKLTESLQKLFSLMADSTNRFDYETFNRPRDTFDPQTNKMPIKFYWQDGRTETVELTEGEYDFLIEQGFADWGTRVVCRQEHDGKYFWKGDPNNTAGDELLFDDDKMKVVLEQIGQPV